MSKKHKAKNSDPGLSCVCLELSHPSAAKVCIAGSFNDWNPSATSMIALGGGKWSKELRLPPGRYEYRLVVDGEWRDDPAAGETVPNGYGGQNAVWVVK